jgi:hypothetical protein
VCGVIKFQTFLLVDDGHTFYIDDDDDDDHFTLSYYYYYDFFC